MMMLSLAMMLASAAQDEGPLPRPARAVNGGRDWVYISDYPAAALNERRAGITTVSLRVSNRGEVEECAVSISSGSPDLDHVACMAVLSRGRYEPARNAQGRRIASEVLHQIVWDPRTIPSG